MPSHLHSIRQMILRQYPLQLLLQQPLLLPLLQPQRLRLLLQPQRLHLLLQNLHMQRGGDNGKRSNRRSNTILAKCRRINMMPPAKKRAEAAATKQAAAERAEKRTADSKSAKDAKRFKEYGNKLTRRSSLPSLPWQIFGHMRNSVC